MSDFVKMKKTLYTLYENMSIPFSGKSHFFFRIDNTGVFGYNGIK